MNRDDLLQQEPPEEAAPALRLAADILEGGWIKNWWAYMDSGVECFCLTGVLRLVAGGSPVWDLAKDEVDSYSGSVSKPVGARALFYEELVERTVETVKKESSFKFSPTIEDCLTNESCLSRWNDSPAITQEDVVRVLRKTAEAAA